MFHARLSWRGGWTIGPVEATGPQTWLHLTTGHTISGVMEMFSVLLWFDFEVQHTACVIVTLDAPIGWLSQFPSPQRCTSITFVSSNTRTLPPPSPWWATHCQWTLSTPPLHLLIPYKLPYRKTIPTSQHFPHTMCLLPHVLCSFSVFLIPSCYSSPCLYPFLLHLSRQTWRFVSWICSNTAKGVRRVVIYYLFMYLFIIYLTNCGLLASKQINTAAFQILNLPVRQHYPLILFVTNCLCISNIIILFYFA
jgi:hypothetical protein